jgi:hypothetical protein
MTNLTRRVSRTSLAVVAAICGLMANDIPFTTSNGFVTEAQARIGRPLTPMSYAGVARRTTRRVYAVGAGAAVATARCVQVVDAYGRVITRCY